MKTTSLTAMRWRRRTAVPIPVSGNRRGSVLLVVIGLLGMLLLLGIAFYSFASSESASSQYYAEAAKEETAGMSPDKLWSFALEQLIVGTSDANKQHSALWGKRHALLTGILGRSGGTSFDGFDLTPYNGAGINLRYSTTMGFIGDPYVDQDYDGAPDAAALLNFNYSPAAHGGTAPTVPVTPAPDVDYTAPDINSLPLAYVGRGLDMAGVDVNVIIPSFHRPQLLRQNGSPIANWQTVSATSQRILRPHPDHRCLYYDSGTMTWNASVLPRFLSTATTNALGQTVNPFPFGTAATLQQGVWDLSAPPTGALNYAWDADNDGDGTREGIWMDLDFPVQTLSDGRKYVPLFSFTVLDADALINLNVSGNQAGLSNPGVPLANGMFVSRSNQGLSRAEINPAWALYADPATDPASTAQHNLFWNAAAGSISRLEMSNMETLFLNMGRPEFTQTTGGTYSYPGGTGTFEPTKYYPGRYGELDLMAPNNMSPNGIAGYGRGAAGNRDFTYLPQAGRSNQLFGSAMNPFAGDDDSDGIIGQARIDSAGYVFQGASFLRMQSNVAHPSYIHPLDFQGNGVSLQAAPNGLAMQISNSGLGGPMQWPIYAAGYTSPGNDTTGTGFINYLNAGAGSGLLPAANVNVTDEADEIIAEWELATTNPTMIQDEILGPDNMLELHATNADLTTATIQARARELAPFNFKMAAQAEAIRKQFTVVSHDRRNFGLSPFVRRGWEFNADADSDGNFEFPPAFISPLGNAPNEPFRQVLRQLLHVEINQSNATTVLSQFRLNLNRLLSDYDLVSGPIGAPVYRDLTPHPLTGLPNTPITAPAWNADSPSGTPTANDQEWWARYDRQRMARDIYVLLYTLGGGRDDYSYVTNSNAANGLYTNEQLREMAQFAVNVVDQLDRDDVITKFEYDRNLQDGWSLDDNPYNTLTDPENTLPDRAVVYGVEAQRLTWSEVLGIISRRVETAPSSGTYTDHTATQINDGDGTSDRYYTYMELRNASPFPVDLSNGSWQIAVQDDPDGIPASGDETDRVQLTLISGTVTNIVGPGSSFTIGTRGGPAALDPMIATNNLPSLFKVDTTGSATPDFNDPTTWIAPETGTLDLDLIPTTAGSPNNNAQFRLTDGSASSTVPGAGLDVTTAGNFLYGGTGGNVNTTQETEPHTFVLRRRANMTRAMPVSYSSNAANHVSQSVDNPWIEVDRIVMPSWREFQLQPSDGMTEVQNKLMPLTSYERAQPFSRNLQEAAHPPAPGSPYRSNSVGIANSNSPASFNQVQLHFDRDFASVSDLLSVPLYGPADVTRHVGQPARFNRPATSPVPLASDNSSYLAQERFLRPQHHDNLTAGIPEGTAPSLATAATDTLNNRWYRLLEFVQVPTRTQEGMRVFPYSMREAGAINLNTLRHRGVLAGLLDDPDNPASGALLEGHLNPNYPNEATMLNDGFEGATRDWWSQFLQSRDGVDPLTGMVLPGTPQGRPFRSLTYAERSNSSIDDTVFRSLPLDVAAAGGNPLQYVDRRGLFEARANADRPSSGGTDSIDPLTRHRLLRKVVNNTTTRSNVFYVWISTRFFEAVEQSNGEIQIGDVLQGAPDHRGFFVIDRSLPEQAFNNNSGRFDFRKFVQYRKTLQ